MLDQRVFHLTRIDVLGARIDHVVDAVADPEIAVVVDVAQVARVVPAVRQRAGVGVGAVEVAGHHAGAAHQDLAHLAGQAGLGRIGGGVVFAQAGHDEVMAHGGQPGRARVRELLARQEDGHAGPHLGGAVDLDQVAANLARPFADQVRRHGGAAVLHQPQRGRLLRRGDGVGQQHGDHGGRREEEAHALFADQAPGLGHVKAAQQHLGGPGLQARQKAGVQLGRVVERRHGQAHVVARELHGLVHEGVVRQLAAVRMQHALGPARGAAGVHEDAGVALAHMGLGRRAAAAPGQGGQALRGPDRQRVGRGIVGKDPVLDACASAAAFGLEQGLGACGHLAALVLEDQGARCAVLEDEGQLLRRQPVVDGVEDGAQARGRQHGEDKGRRVVEKGRDHVAMAYAQLGQAVGVAVDFGIELGVGPGAALAALPSDQGFLVRQVTCRPGQCVSQRLLHVRFFLLAHEISYIDASQCRRFFRQLCNLQMHSCRQAHGAGAGPRKSRSRADAGRS